MWPSPWGPARPLPSAATTSVLCPVAVSKNRLLASRVAPQPGEKNSTPGPPKPLGHQKFDPRKLVGPWALFGHQKSQAFLHAFPVLMVQIQSQWIDWLIRRISMIARYGTRTEIVLNEMIGMIEQLASADHTARRCCLPLVVTVMAIIPSPELESLAETTTIQ